ncbi:acyl-CoA thioesterase [Cryptosporangium sp. NPDC048952]|uniref:acyl-CoA thioesterase n=1 Tax=Cryptosporangium sp. NPDC048952 TaxID=3363961 RepID=UPI00372278CF
MRLVDLLDLKDVGDDRYVAAPLDHSSGARVFGGQLLAQALAAAGRTVPDERRPHSLHGYFLHPGNPDEPLEFEVTTLREGRSQTVRQVVGRQQSLGRQGTTEVIALTAAFAGGGSASGPVLEHQLTTSPFTNFDDVEPLPDTLERTDGRLDDWFARRILPKPVELRFVDHPARDLVFRGEKPPRTQRILMRIKDRLPDSPVTHACGLAYFSDLFLLSSALYPHQASVGDHGMLVASLDHTIWFHGPLRADEWLLYVLDSDWAGQGRGLCQGKLFDATGRLVATVLQEGLIKPIRKA